MRGFGLSWPRSGPSAALVLVLAAVLPAVPVGAERAQADQGKLSRQDRVVLAQARAEGKREVTVLIASQPGLNVALASGIGAQGGSVRFQDDRTGYVRAVVPINQVEAVARLRDVQAVTLDRLIPLPKPPTVPASGGAPLPRLGPQAITANPFLPTRDIGAPQFVAANPTYDGRGVTIGILDTGVDPLTPELQTAMGLDGRITRKIVDWVTATDPFHGDDPTWVKMHPVENLPAGGRFTLNRVSYVAPGAVTSGPFLLGTFDERDPRLGGELGHDVNRDGNPDGSTGAFAVGWDKGTNTVWVDTNQDNSFADEKPLTDYRVQGDVATFGVDDPLTPVLETVPFVVQTDPVNDLVNIGIVSSAHGTHVAGIAAGKGFLGGGFNGAAPEARLVSVRACLFVDGCPLHAVMEGMIYAVEVARADVVNVSLGGQDLLNDGTSAVSLLYDRLIDQYGVQIFAAAGNSGPGLTSVNDPSVATRVMSVGAYVHSDTLRSLYGVASANLEGLFFFSSRGPRADGGFKPEIVAPGAALSSVPGWWGQSFLPGMPLPPGYASFAGTSMAAPQAAGGAALLLSAARQSSMQVNTDQVRQAISSGARYLSGYGAHEQGAGIFQVGAAWSLLRAGIQPVAITSSAPINHSLSPRLVLPNHGPGIYEREGWAAGQSGERTITFTRTTGPAGPVTYNLSFTGNDGAFITGRSITLPLNTPTRLAVTVAPATPGVHSAVLNLDDPATPGIEYRVLNTVVAAEQMPEPDTFATSVSGTVAPIDRTTFYYHVPAGTGAFEVRMRVASGSVRMTRVEPAGLPIESSFYCSAGADCESGVGWVIRTISDPTPGVWEVTLEAAPDATARPAAFTIAGLLLGVSAEPSTWAVDPAPVGSTVSRNLTFTNRFRPYTGTSTGTNLDSVFTARPTIAQGGQWTSTVQVEPLSTSLTAKIGNFSDPRADLRLYALDPSGRPVDLPISNPAPGIYTVVVEAVSVPAGSTQFDYEDFFENAAFGRVRISDAPAPHPIHHVWSRMASVTPMTAPAPGRFLRGYVQVTYGDTVIGSTPVELRNVR